MKRVSKLFMTALLSGICYFGFCQDVKVNINNLEQIGNDDCPYRINGICSTEDIGGVDVQFSCDCNNYGEGHTYAIFTNYNTFPVTVLYELVVYGTKETGTIVGTSIVLGVDGNKRIKLTDQEGPDVSSYIGLKGIIVRKLQN